MNVIGNIWLKANDRETTTMTHEIPIWGAKFLLKVTLEANLPAVHADQLDANVASDQLKIKARECGRTTLRRYTSALDTLCLMKSCPCREDERRWMDASSSVGHDEMLTRPRHVTHVW